MPISHILTHFCNQYIFLEFRYREYFEKFLHLTDMNSLFLFYEIVKLRAFDYKRVKSSINKCIY
jgi:hypothetical protein